MKPNRWNSNRPLRLSTLTIAKWCWLIVLVELWLVFMESIAICRGVFDIPCRFLGGLILACSGSSRCNTMIMYSNRGTVQALCWLLIGLLCHDYVILMTQMQLIVIFMRWEDCLFSLGLCGTEFCARVRALVCVCFLSVHVYIWLCVCVFLWMCMHAHAHILLHASVCVYRRVCEVCGCRR